MTRTPKKVAPTPPPPQAAGDKTRASAEANAVGARSPRAKEGVPARPAAPKAVGEAADVKTPAPRARQDRPAAQPANTLAAKPASNPAAKTASNPAAKPAAKTAGKMAAKTAGKTAATPAQAAAKAPPVPAAGKPAARKPLAGQATEHAGAPAAEPVLKPAPAVAEPRAAKGAQADGGARPAATPHARLAPAAPNNDAAPAAPAATPPKASAPAARAPADMMALADSAKAAAASLPDFDALASNLAQLVEEGGKAVAAYVEARESGQARSDLPDEIEQAVKSVGRVAEYWMVDPVRAVQAQTALAGQFIDLWSLTLRRLYGETLPPVAEPAPGDKRFADKEWTANPIFDFLRQAYVITANWASELAARADDLDPHTRDKAQFYVRQITAALSPTNFVATNPELIRETFAQSGENLVRGMRMLAEDIKAGRGNLRIRQSDGSRFQLGVNMATTPGKVVYRNDLIELIQYAPSTPSVYKRPLLIVPPWINKFYILDLNPEKSFIRWAVSQGLTVFTISWVNPDERQAEKGFGAYMREGVFSALDVIGEITGEEKVTAIGYCVGGTLLSVALAYMAATGDERIDSATLFTTQVDFRDPGELRIFVDEEQISMIEHKMDERGYLEGSKMANAFNMLRPNDLIWSYWVNNYLKGKDPMPFDLLVWNSDSTRMPKANHSYYLRNCYLENNLTQGRMELEGITLDLSKVTIPIYDLAAREDHIAPAKSVFVGAQYFGGPVKYVMAGSGHIAGVVNPAEKPKYQFWSGGPPKGAFEDWVAAAQETPGSWWPDWIKWIDAQAPERVPAREPGSPKHPPIVDAPGDYVRMKS
jgi:polyhydroxyalkanoate synthase